MAEIYLIFILCRTIELSISSLFLLILFISIAFVTFCGVRINVTF